VFYFILFIFFSVILVQKQNEQLLKEELIFRDFLSEIKNKEVSENPIFQMDSKNEKHKRLLTFLLWISYWIRPI